MPARHALFTCSLLLLIAVACSSSSSQPRPDAQAQPDRAVGNDAPTGGADVSFADSAAPADLTLPPDAVVGGGDSITSDSGTLPPDAVSVDGGSDFNPTEADFECLLHWTQVRHFRIVNKAGHMQEALDVANSPTGGVYPVGTIVQLVPFEAMVKRGAGFSAMTNDWEFFALNASAAGTTISARGTQDVVNLFGGNCFNCHAKAMPQWDFICEETHGCDPLSVTPDQIQQLQQSDPRCP